jgi:tetratricopeptide (TPR) repeat protein
MVKNPRTMYSKVVRKPLIPVVFLIFRLSAGGLDIYKGTSTGIAGYLNGIYGADRNRDRGAFPLLNIPMGGRAEGLGSAFTAVADDVSFLESNPAGSARLRQTELAFFHSNWFAKNLVDTMVEGLAFTHRIGNLGLAAGGKWLSTPVTKYDLSGNRLSAYHYSEAAAILNGAYNFSLGSGFSGISVGASLKGAFRVVPGDDDYFASTAMADVGALSSFNLLKFYESPEWNSSLGLAIRNLGPPSGEALPSLAVLGLAYRPLEPLLFSFDLFLPFNMKDIRQSGKPYFSTGLEFAPGDFPSLRGGLQLKQDSLRLALGTSLRLLGEDPRSPARAGARGGIFRSLSLDLDYSRELLSRDRSLNRLALGIRLGLGKGESGRVEALYSGGLEAYAQNDYPNARRRWEEALELDPKFLPAAEALAMLEETLAAVSRVEEFLQTEF